MTLEESSQKSRQIISAVNEAVVADEEFLKNLMAGVAAKGHVLVEDVPGTGKTLTARSFANAMGLTFNRIQFTPDLLPSDITGSHIYNERTNDFEFNKGPIFANVVLADEINRAPPKTQAALLEAMGEKQVSVDNETFDLPEPFFVIATQNPVEHEGTFSLPEAQRDRFMLKTEIGYPSRQGERTILDSRAERDTRMPEARTVSSKREILRIQSSVENVKANSDIRDYILDICRATREDKRVEVGVSPRGVQRLFEVSRAKALIDSRDFVVPSDVKEIAVPTLHHRLVLTPDAEVNDVEKDEVVKDILGKVSVPEA